MDVTTPVPLLVDGIDSFAEPGQRASVASRLYQVRPGRSERALSARQLRRAISNPVSVVADAEGSAWLDALGRSRRTAPEDAVLRAVHQAVLRSFAVTGGPPGQDVLDDAAGPPGRGQVLAAWPSATISARTRTARSRPPTRSPPRRRRTPSGSPGVPPLIRCAPSTRWVSPTC